MISNENENNNNKNNIAKLNAIYTGAIISSFSLIDPCACVVDRLSNLLFHDRNASPYRPPPDLSTLIFLLTLALSWRSSSSSAIRANLEWDTLPDLMADIIWKGAPKGVLIICIN